MLFETFFSGFRTIKRVFGFAFLVVPFANVHAASPFEIAALAHEPTGFIGAVSTQNDIIYVGSENGLYLLSGEYIEELVPSERLAQIGFISSLSAGKQGLFVASFGSGLHFFSFDSGTLEPYSVPLMYEDYIWSTSSNDKYVVADFSIGVAVSNYLEKSEFKYYLLEDFSNDASDEISDVDLIENVLYLCTKFGLAKIDLSNDQSDFYPWDSLSVTRGVVRRLVVSDDSLIFATRNGLTELNLDLEFVRELKFEYPPNWEVEDIVVDNDRMIWIAAGGLYREESDQIVEINYGSPYLSASRIFSVTDLEVTNSLGLLASSAQQGLLAISEKHKAIDYLSEDERIFHNSIFSSVTIDSSASILAADSGYYYLTHNKARLEPIARFSLPGASLVNIDGKVIDIKNCNQINTKDFSVQPLKSDSRSWCGKNNSVSHNELYQHVLLRNENSSTLHLLNKTGSILKTLTVPKSTHMIEALNENDIVAVDQENNLLHYKNSIWRQVTVSDKVQLNFSCIERNEDLVALCSQGDGLIKVRLSDFATTSIKPQGRRYIRDYEVTNYGSWYATNSGLIFETTENSSFNTVGKSYGFFDSDFNFDGIQVLSSSKLLILGDDQGYSIDESSIDSLFGRKEQQKVNVVSVSSKSKTIYEPLIHANRIEFSPSDDKIEIVISATELQSRESSVVEYSLDNGKTWSSLNKSYGSVHIDRSSYGDLTMLFRVLSLDSDNPYSQLSVYFLPPIYWSNTAKKLYVFAFLLLAVLIYWLWQRNSAQRAANQARRVEEKLHALEESDDSMTRVMQNKDAAIAHISHEIRTPLTLVTGPLQTIAEQIDDASVLENIEIIQRNAARVLQLVDQLLEIERLSTVTEIPRHVYDVDQQSVFVIESIRPLAEAKNQQFKLRLKAKGEITLIQDTLQQIFYNLVSNAVKYSPPNSEICISTKWHQGQLHISVKDQGPGLKPHEIKDIFHRFSRLNTDTAEGGVGLGLSILSQLVKANSGTIAVKSEWGHGACFNITLPTVPQEQLFGMAEETRPAPVGQEDIVVQSETPVDAELPIMLIVDDNAEFREYLLSLFADQYRCFVARDAVEGLKTLEHVSPDIVLTDNAMPKMSGLEFAKELRERPQTQDVTIFIISALSDSSELTAGHDLMIDDYVVKPFNQEVLKKKVQNTVLRKRSTFNRDDASTSAEPKHVEDEFDIPPKLNSSKDQQFYLKLRQCLEKHASQSDFNRTECAQCMHVGERQLNRRLNEVMGMSFVDILKRYRIAYAKRLLLQGESVTNTAYEVGFGNPSYFSSQFKADTGFSPSEYGPKKT